MEPVNLLPDEENWEAENFCLKLLCEKEEGWHICSKTFPVKLDDSFKALVKRCSAYLARLYAILQQSSVYLNCFVGKRGKKYREWIEENAVDTPNFIEAFSTIRLQLSENQEADEFLQQLTRCHLPSKKTYWLCTTHQEGPRITKLSTESAAGDNVRHVLFEEDVKMRELMEASQAYRNHKAQAHRKSSVILPAKVMSSFSMLKGLGGSGKSTASRPASDKTAAAAAADRENTNTLTTGRSTPASSASEPAAEGKEIQRRKSMKTIGTAANAVASAKNRAGNGNNKSSACSVQ